MDSAPISTPPDISYNNNGAPISTINGHIGGKVLSLLHWGSQIPNTHLNVIFTVLQTEEVAGGGMFILPAATRPRREVKEPGVAKLKDPEEIELLSSHIKKDLSGRRAESCGVAARRVRVETPSAVYSAFAVRWIRFRDTVSNL